MNTKGVKSKKSCLKHKFTNNPRNYYALFFGPNGYRYRKVDNLLSTYFKSIRILIQTVPVGNLVIVMPMPRGHFGPHKKQMNAAKEFGLQLVSLGIQVSNPYLHLPHKLR